MPQTRDNGAVVPVNADAYNPTGDAATMADSLGVITPVSSQAQRDGLIKFYGRTVRRGDLNGRLEWWDGTQWTAPPVAFAQAAGFASIGAVNANTIVGPFSQTFPAGRFTVAPIVTISSEQTRLILAPANVTTTGFNLYMQNVTSAASAAGTITWSAVQMTPTTSNG